MVYMEERTLPVEVLFLSAISYVGSRFCISATPMVGRMWFYTFLQLTVAACQSACLSLGTVFARGYLHTTYSGEDVCS